MLSEDSAGPCCLATILAESFPQLHLAHGAFRPASMFVSPNPWRNEQEPLDAIGCGPPTVIWAREAARKMTSNAAGFAYAFPMRESADAGATLWGPCQHVCGDDGEGRGRGAIANRKAAAEWL